MKLWIWIAFCIAVLLFACRKEQPMPIEKGDLEHITYNPSSMAIPRPPFYPNMEFGEDNPLTLEGVELGRRLFYDPILSADSSMGCFSCHKQELAFTDGGMTSVGIDGIAGRRSSMTLVDVAFHNKGLFWDGRSLTLEDQALLPVEDPVELHTTWPEVEVKLRRHATYPELFRQAFGIKDRKEITKFLAAKAMAQFQRTIISSGKAKFDLFKNNLTFFESDESDGHDMFFDRAQPILPDAECGHCHNEPLFTSNDYFNNGLDPIKYASGFSDIGYGEVTRDTNDYGKFKAPTLRNIMLTAPYMHDGRFNTMEEVLDHYVSGGHPTIRRDPLVGQIHLSEAQKQKIIAFLHTLTDTALINNPALSNPFTH